MANPTRPTHPAGADRPATSGTPRPIAWVDGRIVPAADATVPLTDDGFLRGDAVFEAVLVRGGRTHALEQHLARMRRSAQAIDLRLPVLRQVITDLLLAWGDRDGALKLIVTRNGTVRGLMSAPTWPSSISLAVIEIPWRTALSGVKTLSYATNQWAVRAAKSLHADDAIIVDGGLVHELPTGAICLVKDGTITTPDHTRLPILDSVTVAALEKIRPIERAVPTLDDLMDADEVFVVSATRPVVPVSAILHEPTELVLPAPGELTQQLREDFAEHVEATLDPLP